MQKRGICRVRPGLRRQGDEARLGKGSNRTSKSPAAPDFSNRADTTAGARINPMRSPMMSEIPSLSTPNLKPLVVRPAEAAKLLSIGLTKLYVLMESRRARECVHRPHAARAHALHRGADRPSGESGRAGTGMETKPWGAGKPRCPRRPPCPGIPPPVMTKPAPLAAGPAKSRLMQQFGVPPECVLHYVMPSSCVKCAGVEFSLHAETNRRLPRPTC